MNKIYKSHKITLLIVLFTCLTTYQTAWAQVANYPFASTLGTYTPITGGTVVVATTNTPPADNEEYNFLPIGFSFLFNNTPYTAFGISANGGIWLGTNSQANAVAGLASFDLVQRSTAPLGEIRYETTGTSPNRTTTIQFSNWGNNLVSGDIYNFQIKLRETTNAISVVYGTITATALFPINFFVGILINLGGPIPDFNLRTITNNTTNNWANSTASTTFTQEAALSSTIFPASGLTYTWSPVTCTGVPTSSNTISPLTTCAGIPFTLSLSASNAGNSYQWQSSPTLGGTYTPITGATSATYSAIQTVGTAYRCVITCVASASFVTSVPVLVAMSATTACYCVASVPNANDTDIGNVTFGTLNNGIATPVLSNPTATGTYTNFTALPAASFARSGGYPFSVSQITSTTQFYDAVVNVFIDYNQNGVFDANERALTTGQTTQVIPIVTGGIIIPATALLGNTRMRVILLEGGTNTTPSCSPLGGFGYGEIEDYTINITVANVCPIPTFINTTATAASVGIAYTLNAGATVATGPALSYSVSPALPAGLFINATTGLISGTPTGGGTPSTTYTVSAFQVGCTPATQSYTFLVNAPPCAPITFINTTAPNGTVGTFYIFNVGATVAVGAALSYTVFPTLPVGLSLDAANGIIFGTPIIAALSATYTVTASQAGCPSASQAFTFAIVAGGICSPIIFTNTVAPAATVGVFYSFNAGATVATGPALSYAAFALPTGLSINPTTGVITGIPLIVTPSANFTVVASQIGCPGNGQFFTIAVNPPSATCSSIIFTNTIAPNAIINIFYTFNAGATVATGSALSYISSALPAGLSINPTTGIISGIPTMVTPSSSYNIVASQAGCPNGVQSFTFAVNPVNTCSAVIFNNTVAPNATLGVAYNFDAGASVINILPLSYSISPVLPAGLSLSATTGIISGTPMAGATATGYTVTAGQVGCPQVTRTFTFAVITNASCAALVFANLIAPNAYFGTPYSFSANVVAVAGGSVTYSVSPALPVGLSLNVATGLITGTPTTTIPIIALNYVVVASQVGCSPSARAYAFAVTGNPATSIDNSLSNQVKVSPNPSNGDFNIDFGALNVDKSIVFIYDAQGKTVLSVVITQNSIMTISLKDFADGIYLMKVQTSKGTILKRLAKQ